jgi:putative transferase (TIGR04331 family)
VAECLGGVQGFGVKENANHVRRSGVRRFLLSAANTIQQKLSRKHDAVIVNSFLPLKEEFMLQLSLWQCPQLWRSPKLRTMVPDGDRRLDFRIDAENYQGFERFVRLMLSEVIPACYLEGYKQLVRQVESLPWPARPKFVFTSNNFDTDEIFKVWVGIKVEEGVPYFAGQHGNNYGTHLYLGNKLWPELAVTDKFITWGWTNGNPRNIPAFVFNTAGRKSGGKEPGDGLLLIELHQPHLFGPEDSYFEFGLYQEEQFCFVEALPEAIRKELTVRLYGGYRKFYWSDEHRWKDRSPLTKIETGQVPVQQLIARSRLVVYSYDSTGLLENLSLNVPTMCFWHGGLSHLLPDAKPYYELLRGAHILADTPEQAAKFIALYWDDISAWWESPKVQDARKAFCDQYARTEKKPVWMLKRLLTIHANQGSSK